MANQSIDTLQININASAKTSQKAIDDLCQSLAKLKSGLKGLDNRKVNISTGITRVGTASKKSVNGVDALTNAFHRNKKAGSGLLGTIGKLYATFWALQKVFGWLKNAVDYASKVTEVQNVVRNAFGPEAEKMVNDFAGSISILNFGMSELTTKQIASKFQAMGVALGISNEQVKATQKTVGELPELYDSAADSVADVSLNLTKLAADLGSFYDRDASEMAQKLQAIYTGQTRPLRDLGIDLTQATLQEWAMKQGLDADIASMTQAQKAMLRYQYVMNQARLSMGDYVATADTWANLVRTIKEEFHDLGKTIGSVVINAFKPVMIALRGFLKNVMDFAKTIADALGAIFGWTIEITASGSAMDEDLSSAVDSVGDLGSGAGNASDGLGDAAGNAKKLAENLSVLPFDELNQLSKDSGGSGSGGSGGSGSGGSGGGGGGGGMSGNGATASLVRTESVLEKITSDIDTLGELGRYISETLTNALNSIDWDSVYEGARNFGFGLATFLNSLITPDLFGALGRTIAGALNTALYFLDEFGTNFNWHNFGVSIGTGINEFFKTFDFQTALKNVDTFASGILTTISSALDRIEWSNLAKKLSDSITSTNFNDTVRALTNALNSAFQSFSSFSGNIDYSGIGTSIANGLTNALNNLKRLDVGSLAAGISNVANGILTMLNTAISNVDWYDLGSTLADKVVEFISNIKWGELFKNATQLIGNIALAILQLIVGALEEFGQMLNDKTALGVDPGQMLKDFISNAFGDVADTASDVVAGFEIIFSKIRQAWNEFLLSFAQDHPNIASFLGLDQEQLKLNIEAEITKQKDLRAEQDKHLPNTADFTKATDGLSTGAKTISTWARYDAAKNGALYAKGKEGWRTISTWAQYNAAVNGALFAANHKNWRYISVWAQYNASRNNLNNKQKTISTIADFYKRIIDFSTTVDMKARVYKLTAASGAIAGALGIPRGYNGGIFKPGKGFMPFQSFASGGFPRGGQIFRARENNNPELVGTLKGSTAVMNNNQIVASVSDGVAKAIAGIRFQMTGFRPPEIDVNGLQSVIEYAVVSALANNATERPIQNYVTVKMPNGEVLARAVDDGHRTLNYRSQAVAT